MTDSDTITPQEPGMTPAIDAAKLEAVLAGKVATIAESLDELTNDELVLLRTMEVQGKGRATVLKAIDTIAGSRAVDEGLGVEIQGATGANIGDRERYAAMHAKDVDPTKLLGPVLTLDGWVLPLPKAQA